MKNVLNLIKINFISIFKGMFNFNKKRKGASFLVTALLFLALLYFAFGSLMNTFGYLLNEVGELNYLIFIGALFSFVFVLFFITYEAQSYFFKTKDFELLSSLPIKNHEIVIAKYSSVLLSAYLYSSIILFPTIVVYFIYAPFNFGFLLLFLLGFLFSPLVPMALGTLLGLVVSLVTSKLKHSNIVYIILFFILLIAYFLLYYKMNNFINLLVQNGDSFLSGMQYYLPSVAWFYMGFAGLDVLYIFLFVILSLVVTALAIILLSLLYKKINYNLLKKATVKNKGELKYNKKSQVSSYLKLETKRYFSYPTYVLNTAFALIFMIILPFLIKYGMFADLSGIENAEKFLQTIIPILSISLNAMFACMCVTTSSSISIEGKQITLLKSLPIKPSKIFFTKILFNNLLVFPFIFISGIINLILFFEYFNIFLSLMLFIIPIISIISFSTFGLLINLLLPKFNFDNVNQVVKQSLSLFIVLLSSMCVAIIPMVIGYSIQNLNNYIFYSIFALIYLIIFVVSFVILKVKGDIIYYKLKV